MNHRHFLALAFSGYFFFCAIPHTPAARYSFLGLALLAAAANLYQNRSNLRWKSPILITIGIFTAISFVSAIASPYPTESLSAFRKEYLTPAALVLIVGLLPWSNQQSKQFITLLVSGIGLGFVVKTLLAFWDGAINHPWVFSPYSNPEFFELNGLPRYVGYFAVDSGLYIPLVLGSILFWLGRSKLGITLLLGTVLAYGIILASGVRSAFIVATLAIVLLLLARFNKPKHLVMLSVVTIACAFSMLEIAKTNLEVQRYVEVFKPDSYSKEKGMSDRYPIWQATSEIVALRPALGFGPGWQKLPTIAKETGLLDAWKADSSYYAQRKAFWFALAPGQTNPHNLAMQLLFEVGALGLLSYVAILVSLLMAAWKARRNNVEHTRWFSATAFVFMACYVILCTTNGFILPATLLILLVAAILATPGTRQEV